MLDYFFAFVRFASSPTPLITGAKPTLNSRSRIPDCGGNIK
jgi:hypothetical protein